ncbi:MAG: methyltransferase domain-containing protein [Magnetococcales bacterium]|nr:methyltransferase domain-containing protein [Magnetococcales bacterium]
MEENEQIRFWRGEFGQHYMGRNAPDPERLRALTRFWGRILRRVEGAPPERILEVGSNVGNNLRALRQVCGAELFALEPNQGARERLASDGVVDSEHIMNGHAGAIEMDDGAVDLAFTSGVMIHIHPDHLGQACREIHRVTRRYVACIEYFSVEPEQIRYRGHENVLFKRDFGGFWMDQHPDLQLIDYGFAWKRVTGLDNVTWWLFEKRS